MRKEIERELYEALKAYPVEGVSVDMEARYFMIMGEVPVEEKKRKGSSPLILVSLKKGRSKIKFPREATKDVAGVVEGIMGSEPLECMTRGELGEKLAEITGAERSTASGQVTRLLQLGYLHRLGYPEEG